jgi:tetratricopeptide (TPR) repeat protein
VPTRVPPDPSVDYVAVARAAYRAGNYEEAIAAYTVAIQIDGENDQLYAERAKTYYMMGSYRQALHDYDEAIELRPSAAHHTWRGSAYAMVGDNIRAIPDFDTAVMLDTLYLNAYVFRAMSYVAAGNASQAVANMQMWESLAQSRIADQSLPASGETGSLDFTGQRIYRIIFEAQSGQVVSVETLATEDSPTDTFLVLLGPDGLPIVADDDSGIGLNAGLSNYRLSVSGGYTVYISYSGADGVVEFSLETGN